MTEVEEGFHRLVDAVPGIMTQAPSPLCAAAAWRQGPYRFERLSV
jgi:hypothetical protein